MIEYWQYAHDKLLEATWGHIQLVGISLIIGILIASIAVFYLHNNLKVMSRTIYFFTAFYAIPSLALFALLIPISGLGKTTAIIALVLYCQSILLRSFNNAISEVDPKMVETALGLGMTENQVLLKVQLPLAIKPILTGIQIAATSVIGIATIAATINAGGLGTILFDGLRSTSLVKLAWGTLLAAGLCLVFNLLIYILERILMRNKV